MRRIIVAITCLISLSVQAEAQTSEHALRGLTRIMLVVEHLDDDSIKCRLTKDLIRSAVLYPTSSAKFQMTDDFVLESLYVNTLSNFYESLQLCVTYVEMRADSIDEVTLKFSGRKVTSAIQLWNAS
jgi:hypothetical protein